MIIALIKMFIIKTIKNELFIIKFQLIIKFVKNIPEIIKPIIKKKPKNIVANSVLFCLSYFALYFI